MFTENGMSTVHNCDFMNNEKFIKAYNRGMQAHSNDINAHWTVHIALWVASICKNLEGDFVECGVDKGILSSSIMQYLDWNNLDKHFFLFDTFSGLDEEFLSETEKLINIKRNKYIECFETSKENFKEFDRVQLIKGSVPISLTDAKIDKVCYLSIDMNCTIPEIAAAEYFWPKLVSGAMILLDDYTYEGYEEQHYAFNKFALKKNIEILSLPTGQGLYVKP